MSIRNILLPTDFSENAKVAFDKAYDLSRQLGAKLYLLHVRDESVMRTAIKEGLLDEDPTDEEMEKAVAELAERRFSELLADVDSSAVKIEHTSRSGDADAVIREYAIEIDADIIVIGRRGAGIINKLKSAILGSVAESIIARSPCPVLIIRREHEKL